MVGPLGRHDIEKSQCFKGRERLPFKAWRGASLRRRVAESGEGDREMGGDHGKVGIVGCGAGLQRGLQSQTIPRTEGSCDFVQLFRGGGKFTSQCK